MPFPAYSTRICAASVAAASSVVVAQVPAGYRLVIRHITVLQTAGTGVFCDLTINPGGPWVLRVPSVTAGVVGLNDQHLVFHEGEQLYWRSFVNSSLVSMHGYLLTGAGAPMIPGALPA